MRWLPDLENVVYSQKVLHKLYCFETTTLYTLSIQARLSAMEMNKNVIAVRLHDRVQAQSLPSSFTLHTLPPLL